MNCFQTIEEVRQQFDMLQLPIIGLITDETPEQLEILSTLGMNDFITKPLDPIQFLSSLVRWITIETQSPEKTAPASPINSADQSNFNLEIIKPILEDNREYALEFLSSFQESTTDLVSHLDSALKTKDFSNARTIINHVKEAATNMNCIQLTHAADALAIELDNEFFNNGAFDKFLAAFNQTLSSIESIQQTSLTSANQSNPETLKIIASELDLLLKENEFIPEALLRTLKNHLALNQINLFTKLSKLIANLQYQEALSVLEQLVALSN